MNTDTTAAPTPGPWVSEYRNRAFFDVFAAGVKAPDSARATKVAEIVGNGGKSIAEMRANARLISAAPDLLAFAQAFVEFWERTGPTDWLEAQARAAITKATKGEQP